MDYGLALNNRKLGSKITMKGELGVFNNPTNVNQSTYLQMVFLPSFDSGTRPASSQASVALVNFLYFVCYSAFFSPLWWLTNFFCLLGCFGWLSLTLDWFILQLVCWFCQLLLLVVSLLLKPLDLWHLMTYFVCGITWISEENKHDSNESDVKNYFYNYVGSEACKIHPPNLGILIQSMIWGENVNIP